MSVVIGCEAELADDIGWEVDGCETSVIGDEADTVGCETSVIGWEVDDIGSETSVIGGGTDVIGCEASLLVSTIGFSS